MSGVLRLTNDGGGSGRSTIVADASNDQTFRLPEAGGTLLTTNYDVAGGTITFNGSDIVITNGDLNVDSGTLFVDESSNRVGIGTTTPSNTLHLVGNALVDGNLTFTPAKELIFGTTSNPAPRLTNSQAENDLSIFTNSIERIRVTDDGNVGIGTGVPIALSSQTSLTIRGASVGRLDLQGTGGNGGGNIFGTTSAFTMSSAFNIPVEIAAAGTGSVINSAERMRIDSTGLVTLKNGGSNYASEFQSAANQFVITNNDSCGLTIDATSATNSSIHFADGTSGDESYRGFLVYNHPSDDLRIGTAGDEQVRIDSQGRVLINCTETTSSNSWLQVREDSVGSNIEIFRSYSSQGTPGRIRFSKSNGTEAAPVIVNDGDVLGEIRFQGYNGTGYDSVGSIIQSAVDGTPTASSVPGRLVFQTTPVGAGGPVERGRITSVGYSKFTNTGSYYSVNSPYHEFYSAGSNSNNNQVLSVYHAGANGTQYGILLRTANDQNDTSRYFLNCIGGTTPRAIIYSNGGFANYQLNNSDLCDEREKKNIEACTSTWDHLKNWEIKKFRHNEDDDSLPLKYGVIAQQIEEVTPDVVSQWIRQEAEEAVLDEKGVAIQDAKEEILRKGVKAQQMTWMAVKALQEAMERIEALEAEVSTLRSK